MKTVGVVVLSLLNVMVFYSLMLWYALSGLLTRVVVAVKEQIFVADVVELVLLMVQGCQALAS